MLTGLLHCHGIDLLFPGLLPPVGFFHAAYVCKKQMFESKTDP